jgi:hypothetical protein
MSLANWLESISVLQYSSRVRDSMVEFALRFDFSHPSHEPQPSITLRSKLYHMYEDGRKINYISLLDAYSSSDVASNTRRFYLYRPALKDSKYRNVTELLQKVLLFSSYVQSIVRNDPKINILTRTMRM